jgi:hypothetical protein
MLLLENPICTWFIFNELRRRHCQRALLGYHYRKISKDKASHKIDAIVALAMACVSALDEGNTVAASLSPADMMAVWTGEDRPAYTRNPPRGRSLTVSSERHEWRVIPASSAEPCAAWGCGEPASHLAVYVFQHAGDPQPTKRISPYCARHAQSWADQHQTAMPPRPPQTPEAESTRTRKPRDDDPEERWRRTHRPAIEDHDPRRWRRWRHG